MKRTSILLSLLLALVAFSHADTINLTSGSGKVYPLFVLPGFSFQFHGGGYDLSIPEALDVYGGFLVNCRPCDQIPPAGSSLFIGSGDMLRGSTDLEGQIIFNAISFVSSLAPRVS